MKIEKVGLFYPTWNHAIAAWEPTPDVRILIPTSQIFLTCDGTFDQTTFKPNVQKRILPFPKEDMPSSARISGELVAFLLDGADTYGPASDEVQRFLRMKRGAREPSSHPICVLPQRDIATHLSEKQHHGQLKCADRRALRAFVVKETAEPSVEELFAHTR